jgi:hypothetical protein
MLKLLGHLVSGALQTKLPVINPETKGKKEADNST